MNHGFAPRWLNRLKKLKWWRTKPRHLFVLVSYPKSGRTWLRLVFGEMGVAFTRTHDGASGSKARPFEELNLFHKEIYADKPIVFLFRDPRDTVVSAYFWEINRVYGAFTGTMAEFIRDPSYGLEKIVRFNLAWLGQGMHFQNFLPITYEEIVAAPRSVVRRILAFAGVHVPDTTIEKVIENNTFARIRQREANGEPLVGTATPNKKRPRRRDPGDPESYKFRRGKSGGYVDYLSPDDIAYCDRIFARHRYVEEMDRLMRTCSSGAQGTDRTQGEPK